MMNFSAKEVDFAIHRLGMWMHIFLPALLLLYDQYNIVSWFLILYGPSFIFLSVFLVLIDLETYVLLDFLSSQGSGAGLW